MSNQRIIVIHGRSTKPARAAYEKLQIKALLQGLARTNTGKEAQITNGKVAVDFVYYGDINNFILSESPDVAKTLTARDPDLRDIPCLPHTGYDLAIDQLAKFKNFHANAYKKVLAENKDLRWLDNAARAVSTFAAITSNTFLNTYAISKATTDMGAYLLTRKIGSEVRQRLQKVLKPALLAGEDICLVSHSMGCMVSYDVLWKYSRMSEYEDVQATNNKITKWLTLGCPLGEAGVKRNLYDGDERGPDRHPANIVKDWVNIAARDDFVAHDRSMKNDFRNMKKLGYVESITDQEIYNCYYYDGVSNPHKLYGYLVHGKVGQQIADWIN